MTVSAPHRRRRQYRTGKTLGSGTYAIVKEAVHIKTGKYYACKVINKKLMEGREYMVSLLPLTSVPAPSFPIRSRGEMPDAAKC